MIIFIAGNAQEILCNDETKQNKKYFNFNGSTLILLTYNNNNNDDDDDDMRLIIFSRQFHNI